MSVANCGDRLKHIAQMYISFVRESRERSILRRATDAFLTEICSRLSSPLGRNRMKEKYMYMYIRSACVKVSNGTSQPSRSILFRRPSNRSTVAPSFNEYNFLSKSLWSFEQLNFPGTRTRGLPVVRTLRYTTVRMDPTRHVTHKGLR